MSRKHRYGQYHKRRRLTLPNWVFSAPARGAARVLVSLYMVLLMLLVLWFTFRTI